MARICSLFLVAALALVFLPADPAAAGPVPARTLSDVPYDGEHGPRLDVHRPSESAGRSAGVLVVHGGSWRSGSKRRMHRVSRALARHGFTAFNVDYRLAMPGQPDLERQQDDLRAAVRWIRAQADRFDVDPRRVGALGSSAGGHLVSLLATRSRGPLTEGGRVAAAVTWSAPFDLAGLRPFWLAGAVENLLGCAVQTCDAKRHSASPLAHVSPDDPPMLIANSRAEVIPQAQALTMAEQLTTAGVRHRLRLIPGSRHGMEYQGALLPSSIAFLERTLSRPRTP